MNEIKLNLKNDRYRKERGGQAEFLSISCSVCENPIMLYQKDGVGRLKRCYLNRIFAPRKLELLQYDANFLKSSDLPPLKCQECNSLIGVSMKYRDGRLAYRLVPGSIKKVRGVLDIFLIK